MQPSIESMHTVDRVFIRAPLEAVFALARDVERWPAFLSHYRWVRVLERRPDGRVARVEMAAWRPFGPAPLRYPAWWVSEMECDPGSAVIRYRHVAGVTRGMEVRWTMRQSEGGVAVEIVHDWDGPRWPLVGRLAARVVIGPVFIHGIAARTLGGLRARAEM
jgi:ribosome-associated toxin RatA of RatAB toxin-antitoxin module